MGKVVLITGGAKGIGKTIALELAKNRYDIVINYLTSHQEAKCLREYIIQQYHVRCLALKADVSKDDQVGKMIEEIDNQLGGVDILINNAGIDLSNLFHLKTADEFRKTLDVNVVGAYNCSKSVSAHMLKQDYGRIINISSTNGMNTYYPMCIDYDASKAALISLTHNLAFEFGPYIHVNCIAPGFIGTENELDGYDEEFLKEEQEKIKALDLGANDYVVKPFYMGELLARIRVAKRLSKKDGEEMKIYQKDYLYVDFISRKVLIDEQEIHLTPIEFNLLKLLIEHRGKVLTHNYIQKEIWGYQDHSNQNALRVFMATLRRKIEKDTNHPHFIVTEVGVGYCFND